MNTARGFLAEYLVSTAVGSKSPIRIEWASHDVESADGSRLEVKASGYLQSWGRRSGCQTPSYSFRSVRTREIWDPTLAKMRKIDPELRVDAWVFALQTCTKPSAYDPLEHRPVGVQDCPSPAAPKKWLKPPPVSASLSVSEQRPLTTSTLRRGCDARVRRTRHSVGTRGAITGRMFQRWGSQRSESRFCLRTAGCALRLACPAVEVPAVVPS